MRFSLQHSMIKTACWLGLLAAAFTQVGCAHPVMVEPSVMIGPSIGYTQPHGHVYGPVYPGQHAVIMPRMMPPPVHSFAPRAYAVPPRAYAVPPRAHVVPQQPQIVHKSPFGRGLPAERAGGHGGHPSQGRLGVWGHARH